MIIAFTGTQKGMTDFQKEKLAISLTNCSEIIHGDCIGADAEANRIALTSGVTIYSIYPSAFDAKRSFCFGRVDRRVGEWYEIDGVRVRWFVPEPPLERNNKIVRHQGVNRLIACPKEFKHTLRSGTWATIRMAWRLKLNVVVIPPVSNQDTENW